MINPGSTAPPHQQIAAMLRSQIVSGAYPPGERLPSIPALTERFGVAKQTVQRAIDQLRLEGAVITKPGSGTYVRGTRRRHAQLSRGRYGRATDQITARLARPDEARLLRIRPDTPVLVLLHIAYDTDGRTLEVSQTCWPGPTSALVDEYQVPGLTPGERDELT